MKNCVSALIFAVSVITMPVLAGEDKALIIDVRSDAEYAAGHIEGALHQPHDEIDASITGIIPDKSQHLILYCRSGGRAARAKQTLEALGYSNVENAGGYEDLKARLSANP